MRVGEPTPLIPLCTRRFVALVKTALLVAAAGNQGWDHDYPETRTYPAAFALPNVICGGGLR
ncbi:MAG: hypothetical protein R3B54_08320 [Bdellovibrionota bacterium]